MAPNAQAKSKSASNEKASASAPAPAPGFTPGRQLTRTPPPPVGPPMVGTPITPPVTNPPKPNTEDTCDNRCCAGITPHTPTKPNAHPNTVPNAPSKPTPSQITAFDTTDDEDDSDDDNNTTAESNQGRLTKVIDILYNAREKLNSLPVAGPNLTIKKAVLKGLEEAIQEANTVQNNHTKNLENNLKEITTALKDIKATAAATAAAAATATTTATATTQHQSTKTWAQVVKQEPTPPRSIDSGKMERLEKLKREREKVELTLTAANDNEETKKQISNMNEEEFAKSIQYASGHSVRGVRKMANNMFKIRCRTEEDANNLRKMNWNNTGLKVIKQTYGVVIHGVSKHDIDFEKDDIDEIKTRIEQSNYGLKIAKINPLRRRTRNPNATTQSIVIHTETAEQADQCIDDQVNIEYRLYQAERFTPQCQTVLCYNCQGYRHKATVCKKPPRCGRCAKGHPTRECNSETLQCAHCNGEHETWHDDCPRKKKELAKNEAIREATPSRYTSLC